MTLSDRLSQLGLANGPTVERRGAPKRAARHEDPFAPLKRSVHEALLEALGPKLYDTHLDERELEQQVTQTLQAGAAARRDADDGGGPGARGTGSGR